MVARPGFPCNFIVSSLYALSSLKYFRKVLKNLYMNNLEMINMSGKIASSKFIFRFCRLMYHLRKESMKSEYLVDFLDSLYSHQPNYMTYTFVDIYVPFFLI